MQSRNISFRSLISLIFILLSFFFVAFLQMEERRQNYQVLKLNRELKRNIEQRRSLEVQRLKALRPQKIEKEMETRTAFSRAETSQIIHLPKLGFARSQDKIQPLVESL